MSVATRKVGEMLVAGSLYRLPETMQTIEPTTVPDTFAVGLHAIEQIGPCVRFVFFTVQTIPELGHMPCRIIHKKLVLPEAALLPGMHATMRFQGLAALLAG
jgi:hypothetical protein